MEKKFGVYICRGCGIKDAMDLEKVAGAAKKVQNYKFHDVLCSPEGVQLIKDDMAKEGVNTIIIAACSPRVKTEEFSFAGAIVERVNIREFVAWTMEPNTDATNDAAYDYLTMGIVKTQKGDLPEPNILKDLNSTILVIGGGIAGMTAALSAAGAGYKVVLVEKDAQLGGFVQTLGGLPQHLLDRVAVLRGEVQALDQRQHDAGRGVSDAQANRGLEEALGHRVERSRDQAHHRAGPRRERGSLAAAPAGVEMRGVEAAPHDQRAAGAVDQVQERDRGHRPEQHPRGQRGSEQIGRSLVHRSPPRSASAAAR